MGTGLDGEGQGAGGCKYLSGGVLITLLLPRRQRGEMTPACQAPASHGPWQWWGGRAWAGWCSQAGSAVQLLLLLLLPAVSPHVLPVMGIPVVLQSRK